MFLFIHLSIYFCVCFSEIGPHAFEVSCRSVRLSAPNPRLPVIFFTPPYPSPGKIWHVRIDESRSGENTEQSRIPSPDEDFSRDSRVMSRGLSAETSLAGTSGNLKAPERSFITLKLVDMTKKRKKKRHGFCAGSFIRILPRNDDSGLTLSYTEPAATQPN